jgi:hypothetical protein
MFPAGRWRFLRDETGAVIGERIRWRWRTLGNSETGAPARTRAACRSIRMGRYTARSRPTVAGVVRAQTPASMDDHLEGGRFPDLEGERQVPNPLGDRSQDERAEAMSDRRDCCAEIDAAKVEALVRSR